MTVKELAESLNLEILCMPDETREIRGGYAGDLLSWVMGRANSGDAWVTIMSNINIAAVAALTDVACIILAEGVTAEEKVIEVAKEKGINLLSSERNTFELCGLLAGELG